MYIYIYIEREREIHLYEYLYNNLSNKISFWWGIRGSYAKAMRGGVYAEVVRGGALFL